MLSIILITRNRCDELKRAILSCEEHISIEHEYVIIDNGSEDNTPQMIADIEIENMNYFYQQENLGVAGGRNVGFELAKGDICYFLDDDAIIIGDECVLDDAYTYMNENKRIYAMGTDCYDEARECYLRPLHRKYVLNDKDDVIRGYLGGSHFIKKCDWNKDYLYATLYPYGGEELYVGLKSYKNNGYVWYYSGLTIIHKPSMKTRFANNDTLVWSYVNEMLTKSYFIPICYVPISWLFFYMRVFRGVNYNFKVLYNCLIAYRKMYNKEYVDRMSIRQANQLIRYFGLKMIL
jgi:glycosyltransferase involved in cell wall biosynthesis